MIRRTTLVALLFAATACGSDSGGDKENNTPDSGSSNDGGGGGGTKDGGGSTDASTGVDAGPPPEPDQVTNTGTACSTNAACQGGKPSCLKNVDLLVQNVSFPGGYCSFQCKDDVECGDNAECPVAESLGDLGNAGAAFGIDVTMLIPSHCYKPCDTDGDCRTSEGYRCATILSAITAGAGAGGQFGLVSGFLSGPIKDMTYCLPPAPPMPEAGTPDAGGGTPDAGGGTPDSGTPDAGAPDANTSDV